MALRYMLLLVAIVTLIAASANATKTAPNRKADFDYFYLVRQWPATFCNTHACTHNPPRKYTFTVHGLWPQRRDGTWPEFCVPHDELNVEEISDLLPELEKAWPSWFSDDETFWNHEWTRHGTCAERVVRGHQHQYFATVLRLHRKLNIQAALESAGITPSNSRRYPVQALKDAIEDEYGVMPHVTCDGQGELSEVWMCINKRLQPIDCADGPHPHAALRTAGRGSVPSNFNCNMVKIPKLGRHVNELPTDSSGISEDKEAVAAAAGAEQGRADDVEASIDATLKRVEQDVATNLPHDGQQADQLDPAAAAAALSEVYYDLAAELDDADLDDVAAMGGASSTNQVPVPGSSVGDAATPAAAAAQPLSSQQLNLLVAGAIVVVLAAVVVAAVVLQVVHHVVRFGRCCPGFGNPELADHSDVRRPLLNGAMCGHVSV